MSETQAPEPGRLDAVVQRLEQASRGLQVWRVMTPDEKSYVLQLDRSDAAFPDLACRQWLEEEQSKGRCIGYVVKESVRVSQEDRLMREAASLIKSLRRRVEELESHLATTIEMKTR